MEKPVHKSHTFSKFWGTAVCKKGSKTFMLMQKDTAFCKAVYKEQQVCFVFQSLYILSLTAGK